MIGDLLSMRRYAGGDFVLSDNWPSDGELPKTCWPIVLDSATLRTIDDNSQRLKGNSLPFLSI
jgi:hypothetical protein